MLDVIPWFQIGWDASLAKLRHAGQRPLALAPLVTLTGQLFSVIVNLAILILQIAAVLLQVLLKRGASWRRRMPISSMRRASFVLQRTILFGYE